METRSVRRSRHGLWSGGSRASFQLLWESSSVPGWKVAAPQSVPSFGLLSLPLSCSPCQLCPCDLFYYSFMLSPSNRNCGRDTMRGQKG